MRRGNRRERQGPTQGAGGNPMNQGDKDGIMTARKVKNLSKKLSYLLRHGAVKEGFDIDTAGFVLVKDILADKKFKNHSFQ